MASTATTAQAVTDAQEKLATAQAAHAAALKAQAEPRGLGEIAADLFEHLVMRTGWHPDLTSLLSELRGALALATAAATPPATPPPSSPAA